MTTDRQRSTLRHCRLLAVAIAGLVPTVGLSQAPAPLPVPMGTPAQNKPAPPPSPGQLKTLTVGECIAIGLEQQPALRAATASLTSAEQGKAALENLPRVVGVLRSDLDVRKQAASRGVDVATAGVQKVRDEIVHDVSLMYYTYVYAKQQDITVTELVVQLEQILQVILDLLKSGQPGLTRLTEFQVKDGLGKAKTLQLTARTGKSLSLAALKEAMGVDPSFDFEPKDVELPLMRGATTLEQVLELTVSRRPELAMAAGGVDVFRLEVEAQKKFRFRRQVETFATGADLHAMSIPTAHRNGDYKPGAVPPEMPLSLLGSREERVARACTLSLRQDAVYDKVMNLVRLEATKAYLTWRQDEDTLNVAKERFNNARELIDLAKKNQALDKEKLIQYLVTAGQAQSDYLTAAHNYVKSLLVLERVTSGGVRPAFPGK